MEHPLDPHKSYAYSPSPAVPHRNGFRQGSASRAYHAADHRRAGEVLRVPEASSNLNSFLR